MSSNKEIERAIEELDNRWEVEEGKIVKSFQSPSFMKAIDFVNDVAKIAERVNHHPIITINCNIYIHCYFLQKRFNRDRRANVTRIENF